MVDPTSVAIGAVAVYAVLIHMVVAYQYAKAQVGSETVNATEADLARGNE